MYLNIVAIFKYQIILVDNTKTATISNLNLLK